ncbi:unnamed protein product [Schistosoma margrebowiei]|uniref:TFIIS N-terminal domain-containing protein n=1 Tax=Schistosoma margrebowiei TaxID=48269 RepID=A0AA85A686_9TREM|nr:unnamed protein product [Schistosoma margrebowiei]
MSSARRICEKPRRSESHDSQNSNKYSTPSSQSEVTRCKKENTHCRTPEGENNGKHTESSSRESDNGSQSTRSSLSFAVKRSGLSNKLSHTAHFERNNSNDQREIESYSCDSKSESSHTDCKSNQRESRTENNAIAKSSLSTRRTLSARIPDDDCCDQKSAKSPYKKCKKSDTSTYHTPTNSREREKSKSSFDAADHISSNPGDRSPSSRYSISVKQSSDVCISYSEKHASYSDQQRNQVGSNTLVAYNSTDDELPHGNKEHSHVKRKIRRKVDDQSQCKDHSLSETRPSNLSSSSNQLTPGKTNSVRVIKGTSRSTWDSSDSDFDSSVVHTEKFSENEHTTSPDNHQKSNFLESSHKASRPLNKSNLSKEAKSDLTTKKKDCRHQDGSSKCDPVNSNESRPKLSGRDSHHRRCRKNSDRHHSTSCRRKSVSSGGSDGSRCCNNRGTSRTKSTIEGVTQKNRKRSRSHRSSSYHSSASRSRYSSRSESSHKYDRHKRSYNESKSYSSRSSARTSRSFRSSYSSRSSSVRTRRHRHVRSFYRRRHRRRSYSLRSRSRSRSWHSTDSSFSSQSSLSSRSRYFSRRNTSKNRSLSRRSRTPLYRPTSSITKVSEDNLRTPPEHRLARLGVGPVSKDNISDSRMNSPYIDPKSISYIPSVDETVSAAVNRVVGGEKSKYRKSSHESTTTNNNNDSNNLKPIHNSKSSVERNSDSHSQPPSSSGVVQSSNKTSSPSVLVDIPLPQDAHNQTIDNSDSRSHTNKSVPYIGPQVPPELAKRFGLSVSDTTTKLEVGDPLTSVSSGNYVEISSNSIQLQNTPNSSSVTVLVTSSAKSSNASEVASFNPPEFTIPPEQVELYRPLQEQAKEHALRRSGILMPDESRLNQIPCEYNFLQQQQVQRQLALLQQQQQSQASIVFTPANVIYSSPSLLPLYAAANTPLISTIPSGSITTPGNINATETAVPQQLSAEAILLKQQQLQQQQQQLSALCGATYQHQANGNEASQIYLGSVNNPHITSSLTIEQPNTSTSFSGNVKPEVNQLSASIQQAQLQQLIAAAALQSAVQANNNNNIHSSANTIQSVNHQQLLNQLIAQQSQLSGFNIAPNLVTASLLAAQHQQKQLIAQWQKRALALATASPAGDQLKSAQERRLPVITPGAATPANLTVATPTSLASIINAANSLPAALQLGLLRSGLNTSILSSGAVNPSTQNQIASMAAIIAAAQQHQQQQQCQQATALSNSQQTLGASSTQFPVSSANSEFSSTAVQSNLLPQQLQQRLLSLQASILHQRQQQQLASLNNAALLQAVIASSQQQQQQQQIVQNQFQQQQAALAAILAAQRKQQQATQDRLNKQM